VVRRPRRALGVVQIVALLLVALGATGAARAQDARELQAKEACLGGHPEKGIELLAQLYAETNDPTYIYNQGRCFEQNGRATEAVTRFREYLRKAQNLAPDEKTDLRKRIDDLEAQTHPAVTVSPAPGTTGQVAATPVAPPDEATGPSAHAYKVAGVVAGGVGVASVAFGVVMGLRARSLSNQVTNDAATLGTFSQTQYNDGRSAERYEIIGYSVGAAALLGGGILYFWGTVHDRESAGSPALTAWLAPGDARIALRVRF
jgi:hypothetical protein